MVDTKERREIREEASATRELFGVRAHLVGDDLINEHGRVIAVIARRTFHAWLLSNPTASSFSTFPPSLLQEGQARSEKS
jgi:hypothetical protein